MLGEYLSFKDIIIILFIIFVNKTYLSEVIWSIVYFVHYMHCFDFTEEDIEGIENLTILYASQQH